MSTEHEKLVSKIQFDEVKTRKAAEILGISYETLVHAIEPFIPSADLTDYVSKQLPPEIVKEANELCETIQNFFEADPAHQREIEEAMNIDPLFQKFVDDWLVECYCNGELGAVGQMTVEKRMEHDLELTKLIKEYSRKVQLLVRAFRLHKAELN